MRRSGKKTIIIAVLVIIALLFGWEVKNRLQERSSFQQGRGENRRIPVEIAPVNIGSIELRRTFSGTLEAPSEIVVAPKIGGSVKRLYVDLGDTVKKGQLIAELDDEENVQSVLLAEAELEVARANNVEAESSFDVAKRELERTSTLLKQGLASDSEYDSIRADYLSRKARLAVSRSQVSRAEALLETARIRLGYTRITAEWAEGAEHRSVAERYVNEGATVSANTPIMRIVELDPILGVFYTTEREYQYLKPGQSAVFSTDAYPNERFTGKISRISPVFRLETRQARVEVLIENRDQLLKPGMFVRTTIVFERVHDTRIIPQQAITRRDNKDGVFRISDDRQSVIWCDVKIGIQEEDRVQVFGDCLSENSYVVTLGQQLLNDESPVFVAGGDGSKNQADGTEAIK